MDATRTELIRGIAVVELASSGITDPTEEQLFLAYERGARKLPGGHRHLLEAHASAPSLLAAADIDRWTPEERAEKEAALLAEACASKNSRGVTA